MKLVKSIALGAACLCVSVSAFAANSNEARPDGHAPIGVMRDHVHKKGEAMLSYRYEFMRMKGSMKNGDNISPAGVNEEGYMMSPLKMDMKMHMVGAMYGLTDKISLMAMGSFMSNNMRMVHNMEGGMGGMDAVHGETSNEKFSGFGDTRFDAMYGFHKDSDSHAQLNLGVSIPTGSIKKTDSQDSRAAYSMQFGSGSYELHPGLSYTRFKDSYSFGGQVNGQFRLDNNNSGYKLGDTYNATTWASKKLNDAFSISSRLNYIIAEKTKGHYAGLNTENALMMSPMNNAMYSGGRRLDFLLGANFIVPKGAMKGHRLALEGGMPIYQKVNGIQMKNAYSITLGWQKAF